MHTLFLGHLSATPCLSSSLCAYLGKWSPSTHTVYEYVCVMEGQPCTITYLHYVGIHNVFLCPARILYSNHITEKMETNKIHKIQ
ncbi:hypothetical protein K449DRAFT_229090 [Hypoxylon sp. EC38]|nr:hypothetical protein K449DRAFT_229090 [Hypoxylon sp. EC38]